MRKHFKRRGLVRAKQLTIMLPVMALVLITGLFFMSRHLFAHKTTARIDDVPVVPARPPLPILNRLAYSGDVLSINPPVGDELPVYYHLPVTDPVVFITIDDGVLADPAAKDLIAASPFPITSFLASSLVADKQDFFRQISKLTGGSIQNHTINHPHLTNLSYADQKAEICGNSTAEAKDYGVQPWLLRPPYGEYNSATLRAAADCGVTAIVKWNVSINYGVITFASGDRLQPGDIILTHYRDDTRMDLEAILKMIDNQGFKIARLEDYLPAGQ